MTAVCLAVVLMMPHQASAGEGVFLESPAAGGGG
jgi:hypothetical protein